MKFLASFTLLFITITSASQSSEVPRLELTPNGIEPVIYEVPGASPEQLYERAYNWVLDSYKDPDEVIMVKRENEEIRISGFKRNAYAFNSLGIKYYYDLTYSLELEFKEGRYRITFTPDKVFSEGQTAPFAGQINWFKNNGQRRSFYRLSLETFDESINNLAYSIYDRLSSDQEKDDDW